MSCGFFPFLTLFPVNVFWWVGTYASKCWLRGRSGVNLFSFVKIKMNFKICFPQ